MSIARRSFLKSATMSTLSAGLALGTAHLIFGQQRQQGDNSSDWQMEPKGRKDRDGNFAVPRETEKDVRLMFRASTFKPYVGDIFQVPNSRGEMIAMTLTVVSEYKIAAKTRIATKRTQQPESFSLTFTSAEALPPFTSIQKISHPALGDFDLFLTGHLKEDGFYRYEAVFNRLQ
jgi:hypothetical protein